ncbi:alpha/beta fold hydrolase [Mycolicibacterium rufum]|uniref:Alpha/beta fold hydrolase n=1 Tax=Mycolicibacterium rufum TaxID=318424 RepID=A0A9X2YEB6_9MYCO|nr:MULTISPECIES: alpha/beta hydrolase [Mycolicibacterium]KGI66185.1 alpha/beta hydrolase [Mycolicibacterium rufum]MCV7071735.1 alpha/beta hydrolase [Mycolicibacterium rufum]OBF58051.1 alpha/beta hydrolase [Mycolicibacterium monacense]ULP36934.1 alpha/beta fold hydrolase [Mycolicibacterium rufum]
MTKLDRTDTEIQFDSGDSFCAATVYRPAGPGPHPMIVMGHGLGSVRQMRMPAYAERFVAAGYSCLLFDYRHFGGSGGVPRQLLDIDRQLQDWTSAVEFARTLPGVDSDRIVLWGTSFGGGHVLVTAARDPRIAAVIAQCPFVDGPSSARASNRVSAAKVTVRAVRDLIAARRGRPPVMVASAGRPGDAALMAAPDCYDGYLHLVPEGVPFENQVAARFGWHITMHRPIKDAPKIVAPTFFAICANDTVAPAVAAQRAAAATPRGEARLYNVGHFDIYVGDAFERAIMDQIAFLQLHVPTGTLA